MEESVGILVKDICIDGIWVRTYRQNGLQFQTRSDKAWCGIRDRCNIKGKTQQDHPTYRGCYMSENFLDFQYFTNWHRSQIGYDIEGYQLDKDLLFRGNKEYSETKCVLIPKSLNLFLVDRGNDRGEYPLGVTRSGDYFQCNISINGVQKCKGTFKDPIDAHERYKELKEEEAKRWYNRLINREFIVDDRVIERMKTWRVET